MTSVVPAGAGHPDASPAAIEHGRHGVPHLPGLDGLRGLAVVAVLGYHGGVGWLQGGYLGVTTFFVLSGFLITTLLLDEHGRTGGIALGDFYRRRAVRLFPAALAAVALVIVIQALGDGPSPRQLVLDAVNALGWTTNWRLIAIGQSYTAFTNGASPFQHFWSLAVEIQCYVLVPALIVIGLRMTRGRRTGAALLLGGAAAISLVAMRIVHTPGAAPLRAYFGTDTRMGEMLVGCLLACALTRTTGRSDLPERWRLPSELAGQAALLATVVLWATVREFSDWLFEGGLLGVAGLSAVVVTAAAQRRSPLAWLLGWRPLRIVGERSYGLYLYHWPLFLVLDEQRTHVDGVPLLAIRLAATVMVAGLSYRWLEVPVRRASVPPSLGVAIWSDITVVLVAAMTLVTASAPSIQFANPSKVAIAAGDPRPRVMVVGDSLGQNLAAALDRYGDRTRSMVVLSLASPGCGGLVGGERREADGNVLPPDPTCDSRPDLWGPFVRDFRPAVVVISLGLNDVFDRREPGWPTFAGPGQPLYNQSLTRQYAALVRRFDGQGAAVVWIAPPCVRDRGPLGGARFSKSGNERVALLDRALIPQALAGTGATVVDLRDAVCPSGQFTNTLYGFGQARPDGIHFSNAAVAALVERFLGPAILRSAGLPSPPA